MARVGLALGALALVCARDAAAMCSPSGLDAVRTEILSAVPPDCTPSRLRRVFEHARRRAASATERAVLDCTFGKALRLGRAQRPLQRAGNTARRAAGKGHISADCALAFQTELGQLEADLVAAANGTTLPPPGATTTTTQPTCAFVTLEVDKGDCTGVTSIPKGVVKCGANCDVQTFTVPVSRPLRLVGTPAPGDTGVTFDTDCDDDGTVPLATATPPDCSLSCDCSSGQ
ncbi:MAG TPA: hypothetical protein VKU61_13340 [Candidatus Binatia bacterium]|nr:hypothetical protein [Candidatus Binatia bacterium]